MNHLRHRIFIILLILLALFLYTSLGLVAEQNSLDFKSVNGLTTALKVYGGWLANGFDNMKEITGNIIGMDWSNTNSSFFEEERDAVKKTYGRGG